jgi:hypothetical protein
MGVKTTVAALSYAPAHIAAARGLERLLVALSVREQAA